MSKPQVLVPLEDLYAVPNRTAHGGESPEHLERAYGVTVLRDHRDRPAVSLEDAYRIRDARQAAAAELTLIAETAEERDRIRGLIADGGTVEIAVADGKFTSITLTKEN